MNTTTTTQSQPAQADEFQVPPGWVMDAQGKLVREELVKEIEKLRDQTVQELIKKALALHAQLKAFKRDAFSDIAEFCATSLEEHGVAWGGKKGNVSLRSYDGRYKVDRCIQDRIELSEKVMAAKHYFDECLKVWMGELGGKGPELQTIVNNTFKVDQAGKISVADVLWLRRQKITHPLWLRGIDALDEALFVSGTTQYVRFFRRVGDSDKYEPITLDISAV